MGYYKKIFIGFIVITSIITFGYVIILFSGSTRASTDTAGYIQFRENKVSSDSFGLVKFDVFLITTKHISQATVSLVLPPDMYSIYPDDQPTSTECSQLSAFPIVTSLKLQKNNSILTLSRSTEANKDISPGTYCFGTIALKMKSNKQINQNNKIIIDLKNGRTVTSDSNGKKYSLLAQKEMTSVTINYTPQVSLPPLQPQLPCNSQGETLCNQDIPSQTGEKNSPLLIEDISL